MKIRHIPVRMRAVDGEPEGVLTGSAAAYDHEYSIGHGLTESIDPGAFRESIESKAGVIPVFWGHGWAKNNATPIGHASVREDGTELVVERAELNVPDSEEARRVFNATDAGALREWSVGFTASTIRKRSSHEAVAKGDLLEISVVLKGAGKTAAYTREDDGDEDEVEVIVEDDPTTDETTEPNGSEVEEVTGEEGSSGDADSTSSEPVVIERAYGLLNNAAFREAVRPLIKEN